MFSEIKAFTFSIICWILLGPFLLPTFFIFYLISCTIHLFAKVFRPELIPITKCDALVTIAPSNTQFSYVYACQVWKVKGLLEVNAFRQHFYQCFLSTEEYRQKYKNLYCYFVEFCGYIFKKPVKEIDLQWHIHQHYLKEGESVEKFVGTWMVTHDSSVLTKMSFEIERPTWMIKLILDPAKNETAIVFKIHHGLCDGYTIVHLVDKLSGQHSPYLFKEPIPSLSKRVKALVQCPYQIFTFLREMYMLRKEKMLMCENETRENSEWFVSLDTLDLESVKFIRRQAGVKFVSVLMSVQIGALKRLLKEVNPTSRLLWDSPANAFIGHSMGWPNHPVPKNGGGMTNHLTFSAIKASFHLDDPLERLLNLDKNLQDVQAKGYPIIAYYFMFWLMKHVPAFFTRRMIRNNPNVFAAENGLSTLSGSPNQHFLFGHQVENIWLPVIALLYPNLNLMTVTFSNSGKLNISVNAKASLVQNQGLLDKLVKVHFVEELDYLHRSCQVKDSTLKDNVKCITSTTHNLLSECLGTDTFV